MNDENTHFMNGSDDVEVIIKLTEVCNINCSYCYVFNKGNDDFSSRPKLISSGMLDDIADFLSRGVIDLNVKRVGIVFHGGEPLMFGKRRFRAACEKLRHKLDPIVKLTLGLQTNAAMIDGDWIAIFEEFSISVGVSLDGPEHIHDLYRVDKAGKGTHAQTLVGIELLRNAHNAKRISLPGAICVINPEVPASEVYNHIVRELGFSRVSFNLPMETVDSIPPSFAQSLPLYLTALFDEWTSDANPNIEIRIFDQMLRIFSGDSIFRGKLLDVHKNHLMVVIASDGTLSEHDDFKVINFAQRMGNVRQTTLAEFANSPVREFLHELTNSIPDGCLDCDWRDYCRAGCTHGLAVSRYSEQNGFNNRSSLCPGFDALFSAGSGFLLDNGLSKLNLRESLHLDAKAPKNMEAKTPIPELSFYS